MLNGTYYADKCLMCAEHVLECVQVSGMDTSKTRVLAASFDIDNTTLYGKQKTNGLP